MQKVVVTATHIGPYEVHPIRQLAQPIENMPDDQWPDFRDSIGKYGLRKKILRYNKKIIDGCQRCRACLETGRPPEFEEYIPRGRNEAEIELELRISIKIGDFDRRHSSAGERAAAIVRLFPPLPRHRPAKAAENAARESVPNGTLKQPSDRELAKGAGVGLRTIKRAREESEDEKAVKTNCIKAVRDVVNKEFPVGDAANIADLNPKQQRECLKTAREGKCSLNSARTRLFSNRDGLSDKTKRAGIHWLILEVPMLGETSHLAIDSGEEKNHLQKPDGEIIKARCLRYGTKPGEEKTFVRCIRCELPMFEADPDWHERKISSEGIQHRECADGRSGR